MTLNSLAEGKTATITGIHSNKQLRNRFSSFGVVKGATVTVERYSLAKQTMEIRINKTRLALRLSEAEDVEVTE